MALSHGGDLWSFVNGHFLLTLKTIYLGGGKTKKCDCEKKKMASATNIQENFIKALA